MPHFAPGASIINISSSRDRMSQPQTESYTAAKGGIAALRTLPRLIRSSFMFSLMKREHKKSSYLYKKYAGYLVKVYVRVIIGTSYSV